MGLYNGFLCLLIMIDCMIQNFYHTTFVWRLRLSKNGYGFPQVHRNSSSEKSDQERYL